ncbi:SDR family NAD(P)-dependent oxidoreductase [Nitratireductor rhodophyticola]|uniref:SDR family NAD(P)-dependent oxidoreductase n=1 Tax=Nitratireductor rhodophyticola TaxID=2854036 RepID=UPI002AC8AB98|nr:SDR family NAD(P)-dependent oxidoreductase [Nitratireductor rhodophyticola]WPZ15661.1 SDR family NAD(P)-dependent oxidoreductase [Nitratireductor rhodophyticola]
MTDAILPPPKKDPQKRTRTQTLPSGLRSRAALGLTAAAAEGRFMLQVCGECGALQYPPRDACSTCLSTELPWRDIDPAGELIAETTVRTSTNTYFRERTPWRVGTVRLDAGPSVMCHVHGDAPRGGRVRIINRLDKSGHGVLYALPPEGTPNMEDDPQLREITADPKFRRVLITDARSENALALAEAFAKADASIIFIGEPEGWRPYPHRTALEAIPNVQIVPLDVTDTASVAELAGEIGGKTDILVNNARFVRPGGIMDRGDTVFARDEMEVNYLGLMRLAQSFGPAMRGRGADGNNSAAAWVNILSVYAYSNMPAFGAFSASNAAAYSLSQCLRAEMRPGGVRVMNVYTGPTDDAWHQPLPPPKVAPAALARSIVSGLKDGLEDVFVGDVAKDLIERWRAGAKVLEREMSETDGGGA